MTTGVGSRTKYLRMMVSAKAETTALEAIAHSLSRVLSWRKASSSYVERLAILEQELEEARIAKDEVCMRHSVGLGLEHGFGLESALERGRLACLKFSKTLLN